MNKLFTILAASVIASGSVSAQETPSQTPSQTSPEASVTQFLFDSAPTECTLKVTAVIPEAANRPITDILAEISSMPCEAVSGTDDSSSKNFNFLNLSERNFYKVITESEPIAAVTDDAYQFSVEGVKVVPLDEAGNVVSLQDVEYLFPSDEQTCIADAVEEPHNVVCTFKVIEANNVLVGQLQYVR